MQTWNGETLPSNYAYLPESLDTVAFYQYNGCVDLTLEGDEVTQITPNVTAWNAWTATADTLLTQEVRQERDARLTACDWTQMPDSPLDADAKTAWQVYRQALRDVPEQEGFPCDVTWPAEPV